MVKKSLQIKIFLLWCILLVTSCSQVFRPSPEYTGTPGESDEAYKQLSEAEQAYADGVIHNMKQEWDKAQSDFDKALQIISIIDVDNERDKHLVDKIDLLLREIAYDYQITIVSTKQLSGEGTAPAILSLALNEKAMSKPTQRQLDKLISQLPTAERVGYDIPIVWNDKVKEKIIFFQTDCHEPFQRWLTASGRYTEMMRDIFYKEGLPQDLVYLPLVESGFNPNAYSWAHAVGIWQFIKSTGKIFDLQVGWWRDERRDPVKSTYAAARYLKNLYKKFKDWEIALAAYNCGDGRMERSIKSQKTDNYWELDLPKQTENYIPLFMAAVIIAKNPERYGFKSVYHKPYEYDIINVSEVTNLKLIAECTDTTFEHIQELNPEILRWCTPPNFKDYKVRVPKGKGKDFYKRYAQIPEEKKNSWARHKVRKGETLSEIAMKYRTSVQAIVDANKLSNKHKLSIGQNLLIPISPGHFGTVAENTATPEKKDFNGEYVVKKNDTLSEIADNAGVSVKDLSQANSINANSTIHPGQKLKVPGEPETEVSTVSTYTVRVGDTPSEIAERHGISLSQLLSLNNLTENSTIYPGQKLSIKGSAENSSSKPKDKITHTVKRGESLWSIAQRYLVSISDLVRWNNLPGTNSTLHPGDKLIVLTGLTAASSSGTQKITYTVKKGDYLYKIAKQYGVSIADIKNWNGKTSDKLAIGEKLTIYSGGSYAQEQKPQKIEYYVKKGDSFYKIAHKHGISINDLKMWNNKTSDMLSIGEKLVIYTGGYSPVSSEPKKITYVVKKGDTLYKIASVYKTTPDELVKLNELKNPNSLQVGDRLTVYTRGGE
ncbi:LysM peptidoglycan-binding domain-containing protein [bacterium]|nr:LysM peptidoglycan-binding domain-containing protein [bacterium]